MPSNLEEITAIFLTEFFRNGEFCMANVRLSSDPKNAPLKTIKGEADEDELKLGLEYRFYGKWQTDKQGRTSFAFRSFVRAKPHTQEAIVRYLQEAPHVGPATALKLWDKFQGDAVRILREEPDVAACAVGGQFTPAKAQQAAAVLAEMAAVENCSIDLLDLLQGRGFPKSTSRKVVKDYGNEAAAIIRRKPYVLMRYHGVGFLRTDAMYLDLGHNPAARLRQALCCWHTCASDTNGHTWFPIERLAEGLKQKVAGAKIKLEESLEFACRAPRRLSSILTQRRDCPACGGTGESFTVYGEDAEPCRKCKGTGGKRWYAEGKHARSEAYIARCVARAGLETPAWPDLDHEAFQTLTDHQRERLALSLRGVIAILGGSPGTGKTFSAAAVAKALIELHGADAVKVAAPTGKAAVRITESLAAYGLPIRATTIHRMLGVKTASEGSWGFDRGEDAPIDVQYVIFDESSMIDASLMAALFAARGVGTHYLFVGDTNQLPPVGVGAPLRDFIGAGVAYGELREIKRNAGTIVHACAAIRDNKRFEVDERIALPEKNLGLIPAENGEQAIEAILRKLREVREAGVYNPIWDAQVIVAVNAKSALSRKTVNQALQLELNPGGAAAEGNPFRVGDKIVCLKNSQIPAAVELDSTIQEKEFFVANGEQAKVLRVEPKLTFAELSNPRRLVKIPRGQADANNAQAADDDDKASTGCDWDLAYAISCHKSQGSEWPIVLVALDEYYGAKSVCSREWLYTAISRAKKECHLVGKKETADSFCRRVALHWRKTFLKEQILEQREELRQAALRSLAASPY